MMIGREEQAAVQADAYIDALLARHRGVPAAVPDAADQPPADVRRLIHLLEAGLPRLHPSFSFEEGLAVRLRAAAATADTPPPAGQLIALPGVMADVASGTAIDRRLLIGGAALASGVSIAGAVLAWRRLERSRRGWLD